MKYRALFIVLAFFAASNRWLQAAAAVTTTDVTAGTALSATTHNTNFGNVRTALNKLNPNGWTNGGTDIGYTDGKMGIGIGVPITMLHLSSTGGATRMIFSDLDQAVGSRMWRVGNYAGGNLGFMPVNDTDTNSTNVLTLQRNGNVGIGTGSPAARLHLTQITSTNSDGLRLTDGGVNWNIYGNAAGALKFESSGGANFAFTDAGNVCIGCNATGSKLQVSGQMAANKIDVQNSDTNWTFYGISSNPSGIGLYMAAASGASSALHVDNYNGSATLFRVLGNSQVNFYSSGTTVQCTIGGTVNSCTSDTRLKENITDLPNILSRIQALRGVSYTWRETGRADIGILAQEVEKQFPQLVTTNAAGFKMVSFNSFHGITIQAIKELKSEKDRQITALAKENNALRAELTETKKSLVRVAQRVEDQEKKYAERLARVERNLAASTIARR